MQNINLRFVETSDVSSILSIYAPYVESTSVTFEYDIPSLDEFKERIINISSWFPYLVCELNGEIAGYCYSTLFKTRAAYQWDVEVSVYISEKYHHRKIASAFYYAMLEILKLQGYCTAYAVISVPNEKSIGFHLNEGFVPLGTFPKTGYKHSQWHDVMWLEKSINPKVIDPKTPVSVKEIDMEIKNSILKEAQKKIRK